ncbi:HIRAN domain-containing protein [Streptococcus oricebi]|uniref:Restriction endonuclease n=1 Tax=Streptococcus oricebi TaxID=1547447 RepID=A0ABS5B5C6_9STRE|nr:HIRAN domain-containing protein [Streptococcus oricebi]MBP2624014.1 restriction endonuclease [Streptococcus oricebi]
MKHTFIPSRHFLDFHISGFAYHDGLEVIEELKLGQPVQLVVEPDNPYDPKAVAIYYSEHKIGYVPNYKNQDLFTLLYFGHDDIFDARIQSVQIDNHPERQFRVVVKVRDKRKEV